ncbi:protein SCO2 homolog, mitochondrial-like, partial [Petromyzon marinus]|uniref:protein SCO2 homolog, mitochondrial-like n=1 Tax=Petromyzon marinus TaxID=7757 RepID=UPI003F6F9DB6
FAGYGHKGRGGEGWDGHWVCPVSCLPCEQGDTSLDWRDAFVVRCPKADTSSPVPLQGTGDHAITHAWIFQGFQRDTGLNDHIVGLGGVKFELTDQSGRKVKGHDLLVGQWSLLYFGFTHCPDVCPEEMEKVSGVVHTLDKDTNLPRVQPVFVTIDPQRDDVAAVAQYIKDFHPRLVGLTGSPEQISAISKAYRVYAQPGPRDPTDQEYVVDHSIITYLICPHGAVLEFYNRSVEEADMAEKVRQRLRAHRL